ncbi:MAG: hypothetical protein ACLQT7_01910 [Candidatus Dormibacteria bacterium]
MRSSTLATVLAALGTACLAACSATTTPSTSSSGGGTTPSSSASTATPSAASSATAVATSLDPCQMVTASEASSLSGATYGAGVEGTTSGGGKTCTYGAETTDVFEVILGEASSASVAQADWAQEEGQVQSDLQQAFQSAQSAGVTVSFNVNDVTNVSGADRAAVGTFSTTISGVSIGGTALYLLKGADFVAFSDLEVGHAAPSASAMESQGSTTVGRLS